MTAILAARAQLVLRSAGKRQSHADGAMDDVMSRRGDPAAKRTAARLRELGTLRYWTKRQHRSRREIKRSIRGQRLRGSLEDQQRDLGIAEPLPSGRCGRHCQLLFWS